MSVPGTVSSMYCPGMKSTALPSAGSDVNVSHNQTASPPAGTILSIAAVRVAGAWRGIAPSG